MAWVCNDPTEFTDEMVDGFVEATMGRQGTWWGHP